MQNWSRELGRGEMEVGGWYMTKQRKLELVVGVSLLKEHPNEKHFRKQEKNKR